MPWPTSTTSSSAFTSRPPIVQRRLCSTSHALNNLKHAGACIRHIFPTSWSLSSVLQSNRALHIRYYEEKGFQTILVSRILNLLALAFTIAFSGLLLLFVRWEALRDECIIKDTCDMAEVGCPVVLTLTRPLGLLVGVLCAILQGEGHLVA